MPDIYSEIFINSQIFIQGYFVPPRMSNYDAANKHASERNVDYISEDDDDEEKRRRE